MKLKRFFFYGSLRSGFWNNFIIERERLVSKATTVLNFRLFVGSSGVPYLVYDKTGYPIVGEVWEVRDSKVTEIMNLERGYVHGIFDVVLESGERTAATVFYAMSRERAAYRSTNEFEETTGDYTRSIDQNGQRLPKPISWIVEPLFT